MNYTETAKAILNAVGGSSNVSHLEHCSTRLRFSLIDKSKADVAQLKKIEGVVGVVLNVQCQVVIGNDVAELYEVLMPMLNLQDVSVPEIKGQKQKISAVVLDFVISIFQPLIPAIAGGGILKSLLMLLNLLKILDSGSPTYQILNFVGTAPLYFLPILVAYTTAKKLKVNVLVAASVVGALLMPELTDMLKEGTVLFGIPLTNIAYAYQVFPAILSVLFYAQMEKLFTKISPKVIRGFFVPMMSMLITVPTTLIIIGPIGFLLGQKFATVIMFIFAKFGWVAVAVLAAFLPFMVLTGMHKAMIPYVITALGETGKELIYMAASLAHNISEGGAMFAAALRTKDKNEKTIAVSAGISAMFGITEPALYSITVQRKRVLYGVMLGSFVGGAYLGMAGVEAYVAVGPGIASLSMFISETLPNNIIHAIIGLVVSFVTSFVAVFILWKDEKRVEKLEEKQDKISESDFERGKTVKSPIVGKMIPLSEVKDEVFSNKVVGEGVAIIPSKGELYAPADGTIEMIFDTKHALAMKTDEGAEILFHIGLETVNLQGRHFEPVVQVKDKVKAGDLLVRFDVEKIKAEGFDPVTIVVVTNMNKFTAVPAMAGEVNQYKPIMSIKRKRG
jgi:PTS system beta-glucosides-specific IIC component